MRLAKLLGVEIGGSRTHGQFAWFVTRAAWTAANLLIFICKYKSIASGGRRRYSLRILITWQSTDDAPLVATFHERRS
jgi:hypothetical protein